MSLISLYLSKRQQQLVRKIFQINSRFPKN